MLKKSLSDLSSFLAGDHTQLIEVLHPKNDPIDLSYSLAHAVLLPDTASLVHVLKESSETYFVLQGEGRIYIDEEQQTIRKGDIVLVPKGSRQYVENTGIQSLEMLCICSPPWSEAQEEVIKVNPK